MSTGSFQREHALSVLRLPHVGRRIRVPTWAVAIVVAWLGLVGLSEWLEPANSDLPSLCRFKAVTGVPCPTCGATRAVKAAASGDFLTAWLMNPFVVTAMALGVAWLTWRLVTGRAIIVRLSRTGRVATWSTIALLFALNWVYLIWRGI